MTVKNYIDASDMPAAVAALQRASDKRVSGVVALANAAGQTLTAAQMLGSVLLRSGAAGVTDTTLTAAQLVAALPGVAVGDTAAWQVRNNNTGTLTIGAGAGVTLEGTTTIPTVNFREYRIRFTNVTAGAEAVTISGLYQAAV